MPSQPKTLTFTRTVNAPPQVVYFAFSSATGLREWLCDGATANVRPGGSLHLWWHSGFYASGEFTTLEPDKRIDFTWLGRGDPHATRVSVELAADGEGTLITLTHTGMGSDDTWEAITTELSKGWITGLENLQSVVETGTDLRLARRPMLGVTISEEITPKLAARLDLPVHEGIQIDSVVEGMGAEAAGLQKGDVIVRLGSTPITRFQSVIEAVSPHQAGDELPIVFYRGGEKHSTIVRLSGRKEPEVPPNPADLAARSKALTDQMAGEIEDLLAGISEEEADYSPAEGEWNVKQTLAHLIISERILGIWLSTLISGREIESWPDNITAQVNAVVSATPTLAGLLAELKKAWQENTATLAALPDEFVARKGSYTRAGANFLQVDIHIRSHFDQLREAVAAARAR